MQGAQEMIPGLGRSPGIGNAIPLQYSCLENSLDRGAYSPWGCKESDTTERLTLLLLLRKYLLKTKKKGKEVLNMHLLNDRYVHCGVWPFSCTCLHDTSPFHPQDAIAGVGMGKIAPFWREEFVKGLQLRQFLRPALQLHLLFPFILTRIPVVCKIQHQL